MWDLFTVERCGQPVLYFIPPTDAGRQVPAVESGCAGSGVSQWELRENREREEKPCAEAVALCAVDELGDCAGLPLLLPTPSIVASADVLYGVGHACHCYLLRDFLSRRVEARLECGRMKLDMGEDGTGRHCGATDSAIRSRRLPFFLFYFLSFLSSLNNLFFFVGLLFLVLYCSPILLDKAYSLSPHLLTARFAPSP